MLHFVCRLISSFQDFVLPTRKYADIIVPRGYENERTVLMMVMVIYRGYNDAQRQYIQVVGAQQEPIGSLRSATCSRTFQKLSKNQLYSTVTTAFPWLLVQLPML